MEPRTVKVGRLVVKGQQFAFEPAPALRVQAKPGEELEFVLTYQFDEASPRKEALALSLEVRLPGAGGGRGDAVVEDRPGLVDSVLGSVPVRVRLDKPGEHQGSFAVEARYTEQPWGGGAPTQAEFHRAGTFTVRVA